MFSHFLLLLCYFFGFDSRLFVTFGKLKTKHQPEMSVILRKRKNQDGTTSLLLDIYHDGKRRYVFLKHLKLTKGTTVADRQKNKENLELAHRIALKQAQELAAGEYNLVTENGKKTVITEWMQTYIDKYKKKDVRNLQGALNRFKNFLNENKIHSLTFGRINDVIISDFQDYLREHSKGEGASSYFARFKKMMKQAYRQRLMDRNPAADVPTIQGKAKKKDILTIEEIQTLAATRTESPEVKRAFLFSCVTGLRWIDIKNLRWENINNKAISIKQSKTERDLHINLNETALKLLGEHGEVRDLIFDLPTANGANKTVKAWVTRVGIKKNITWHNARHSFGTNLIYMGADVTTASNLLGHSTLKHTSRYVKAANELKERATDMLNFTL
jgi:integrase/recombinase XerD